MPNLNRRDFIKTVSMATLAMTIPINVFAADKCTVKTRYGKFSGFVDGNGVKNWLGIPYAQPPVGKLRWRSPQPLAPSNKTFDAKKFGFAAMQPVDEFERASLNAQSEDCLTLNIWTRGKGKNKPVMVFIHGGGFQNGGSSDPIYNCANIAAAQDVVIASINYRLNVFGFVDFSSIDASFDDSGYLGTKDQVAALKWIKENISEFGGNPDNITIFGESAGAISCMMLSVIPAVKGTFQKAIPQSANSYMFNTKEHGAEVAAAYLELGGAKTMSDMLKKSSAELISVYEKVNTARPANTLGDYLPICDGKFLPKDPFKSLKEGGARGIKFLTGTTADEWCYWLLYLDDFFEIYRAEPEKVSPALQKHRARTAQTPEEVYQAWLNNRPDTKENFIEFTNQVDWRVGQELSAEYQSGFGDVYYYLFSEKAENKKLRSCHAVDLPFTFNISDVNIVPNPAPNLVKIIQTTWAAFAANGSPDNELIPHWEKYSVGNRQTMELNSKKCVLHKDLNTENLNSLRKVYES